MDLARFVGLDHDAGLAAQAVPHQVVVDGSDGEQGWDRRPPRPGVAVCHDQDGGARAHRAFRILRQALAGCAQAGRSVGYGEGRVQIARREGSAQRAHRLESRRIQEK